MIAFGAAPRRRSNRVWCSVDGVGVSALTLGAPSRRRTTQNTVDDDGTSIAATGRMPRSSLLVFLVAFPLIACGEPGEESCEPLPPVDPGTGYVSKNLFDGRWQHTATLLDASATSGLSVGSTTEPIFVDWVIFEDRLAPHDAFGPLLALALVRHVDDPNRSVASPYPVCPPLDRPWYDRALAQVDWRTDLVAAPDALAVVPSGSAVEPLTRVRLPTFVFSEEREAIVSLSFRMSYRVTADCEGCDAETILVEHRFLRRFDLEDAR